MRSGFNSPTAHTLYFSSPFSSLSSVPFFLPYAAQHHTNSTHNNISDSAVTQRKTSIGNTLRWQTFHTLHFLCERYIRFLDIFVSPLQYRRHLCTCNWTNEVTRSLGCAVLSSTGLPCLFCLTRTRSVDQWCSTGRFVPPTKHTTQEIHTNKAPCSKYKCCILSASWYLIVQCVGKVGGQRGYRALVSSTLKSELVYLF